MSHKSFMKISIKVPQSLLGYLPAIPNSIGIFLDCSKLQGEPRPHINNLIYHDFYSEAVRLRGIMKANVLRVEEVFRGVPCTLHCCYSGKSSAMKENDIMISIFGGKRA